MSMQLVFFFGLGVTLGVISSVALRIRRRRFWSTCLGPFYRLHDQVYNNQYGSEFRHTLTVTLLDNAIDQAEIATGLTQGDIV